MLKLSSSGEGQPGEGEQLGQRVAEAGQAAERPAAERQRHQPRDGDQLERHAVGQDHVEGDDRQRRHDHVEAVHREAGVPVHAPARQLEVWEQVVAQVGRTPDVGAHVAAGRGVVVEDQVRLHVQRVEVDHVHHDHGGDDQGERRDGEAHRAARSATAGVAHSTGRRTIRRPAATRRVASAIGPPSARRPALPRRESAPPSHGGSRSCRGASTGGRRRRRVAFGQITHRDPQ